MLRGDTRYRMICAGDIAARIYQPGYSGYRGGRQENLTEHGERRGGKG
jgi:hypothetical protein